MADEIDYTIIGDDLQAVIITLDPGEMVIAEAGAMMYMQDGIVMNTTLDPNAQGGGLLGKLFQGAKRSLSGDTFFVTTFGTSVVACLSPSFTAANRIAPTTAARPSRVSVHTSAVLRFFRGTGVVPVARPRSSTRGVATVAP